VSGADLCFTSAVEQAALIRRRAVSPVEITRTVLERIERMSFRLGAYVLVSAPTCWSTPSGLWSTRVTPSRP